LRFDEEQSEEERGLKKWVVLRFNEDDSKMGDFELENLGREDEGEGDREEDKLISMAS
jgi:hypothetical protein